MKAISLHQPWASLVALGIKTIETRSWSTSYRGPLAIHAAKRSFGIDSATADVVRDFFGIATYKVLATGLNKTHQVDPEMGDNYPLCAVVATCNLVNVLPIRDSMDPDSAGDYIIVGNRVGVGFVGDHDFGMLYQVPYGDFTPGGYAWLLANIKPLSEPIPAKGKQGLWKIDL